MLGKGMHSAHVALDMYSKCVERCLYISVMAYAKALDECLAC